MINELMLMPSFYVFLGCFIVYVFRAMFVGFKLYRAYVIEGKEVKDEDVALVDGLIFASVVFTMLFSLISVVENMQDINAADSKKIAEIITYYDDIAENKRLGTEMKQSAVYALIDIQAKLESNDRLNNLELTQIIERKNDFEKKRIFLKENTSY